MSNIYTGTKGRAGLPNPFRTYSNFVYPKTIKDVFIWATYLWERVPAYRTSIAKVVSYFLSGIKVKQSDEEAQVDAKAMTTFQNLLEDTYGFMDLVLQVGQELASTGNVFISAERIFARELLCPNNDCGFAMRLNNVNKDVEYKWTGKAFTGTCPRCGKQVTWRIKDVESQTVDGKRIRFVFRSPEDMNLQYNRLTDTYRCLYKLPEDISGAIRRGDTVYLEDTPQVFIDAAVSGHPYIKFPDNMFFHSRIRTLSALDKYYKGWGLPLFMVAFDNIIRRQHLDKFNEAVILDYLVPTRIISPAPANLKAGIDDPQRMPMSGAAWRGMMTAALKGRITNPTQWIISPVPVQEQQIGGNKDVIPTELLEYETSQILTDIGIPQEFRQTTFQVVAPSMGLRMFERQWVQFARGLDRFVAWAAEIVSRAHSMENMKCSLDTTSFVEDDMNKQVLLNLMQGGMIAKTAVLQKYGIDYEDDLKQQAKEQQMQQDIAMEQQQQQQGAEMLQSVLPPMASVGIGQAQMNIEQMQQQAQAAQGGQPMPPQGGAMPGAPGVGMPFNQEQSASAGIEQMYQQAQQMAQELYAAPHNVRYQQLTNLKATNPTLHAQVKQILDDMEQQVASDAVAQSKQPQG